MLNTKRPSAAETRLRSAGGDISKGEIKSYIADRRALAARNANDPNLTANEVIAAGVELAAKYSRNPDAVYRAASLLEPIAPYASDVSLSSATPATRAEFLELISKITAQGPVPDYIHPIIDGLAEKADNVAINVQEKLGEYPLVGYAVTALDWGLRLAGGVPRAALSAAWDEVAGRGQEKIVGHLTAGAENAGYNRSSASSIGRGLFILGTLVASGAAMALAVVTGVVRKAGKADGQPEAIDPGLATRGFRPPANSRLRIPGIPKNWDVQGSKHDNGIWYTDPHNIHNSVRYMPGYPNSRHPNSQGPYVRWQRNGHWLDADGKVTTDPAAAHIPIKKFKFKPEVFAK